MSLIPSAHAQDAAPAGGDLMVTLIMFGALFLFMWFIVIRPQRKRQKEHQALVNSLSKGDEVVMTSGMLAKVTSVEDDYVVVKASDNVELRFQKVAVHAVLPKGTIKSVG